MKEDILKIKVLVDGRLQTLDIHRDAEQVVREAAKRLNSKLFEYRRDYKLDSADDYLRMVALQYAISVVESEYREDASILTKQLKDIEDSLSEHLSKK